MKSHETPEESLARAGIVEVPIGEQEAAPDRIRTRLPTRQTSQGVESKLTS